MHASEVLLHMRRNHKASPQPHRHMKALDELDTADMELYEHAVKVMVQQKDLLSAVLQHSHCDSKLATAAETLGMGVGY